MLKSSLPLVEQGEQYVLANHSKVPPYVAEEFLSVMRVLAALKKIGSSYLKKELQRDAHRFLEEFTNSVLSWFSCSTTSVQIMHRDQYGKAL